MTIGRPLKYKPDAFAKKIETYFKKCRGIPNKAGLMFHLGISRETWREYKKRPEFVDTINATEFKIEEAWIQRLLGPGATGPIFYLKNAFKEEYKDSHDVTSAGEKIQIPIYGGKSISEHNSDRKDIPASEKD